MTPNVPVDEQQWVEPGRAQRKADKERTNMRLLRLSDCQRPFGTSSREANLRYSIWFENLPCAIHLRFCVPSEEVEWAIALPVQECHRQHGFASPSATLPLPPSGDMAKPSVWPCDVQQLPQAVYTLKDQQRIQRRRSDCNDSCNLLMRSSTRSGQGNSSRSRTRLFSKPRDEIQYHPVVYCCLRQYLDDPGPARRSRL